MGELVLSWQIKNMLTQHVLSFSLFFPPIVWSQLVADKQLYCPYPLAGSLKPSTCLMQAEYEYSEESKKVLLGSFAKTVGCYWYSKDEFDFVKIVEAFEYDNRIAMLQLDGDLSRKYFLTKEDFGRLNVSGLKIETEFSKDQQLFEPGALAGSKGSLKTLEVKFTNTYKVQEREGDITLDYLKEICPDLMTLVVYGVSLLNSEDFKGCSQLTHLTLEHSNLAIIGPDFFKHLPSVELFRFSSRSKFWIQTGAFRNLPNLTSVEMYKVEYFLDYDVYPLLDDKSEHYNKTVISRGAFDSLPNLTTLKFAYCETLYRHCRRKPITIDLFEEKAFLGLEKLREFIVLKGNQEMLPRLFDNAPELNIFKFQPGLKVVEADAFEGLPALNEIDLSDNKIATLNNALQNLPTYLRKVDLSKNDLTSLGNVAGNLTYLRKIILKDNKKFASFNKDFLALFKNIEQYGSRDHFQIDINDISLGCGCDIRWLLENRDFDSYNMLNYFVSGARCASGLLLKDTGYSGIFDAVDSNDFSVKTDDLLEKSILDLTCPPNREF